MQLHFFFITSLHALEKNANKIVRGAQFGCHLPIRQGKRHGQRLQPQQALVHSEKGLLQGAGGKGTKLTQYTC